MIDIQKQVIYWRDSSLEDWQVAGELIAAGHLRHGLFFAQLALEKILKAHVCNQLQDIAPRIHNLVRLAEIAELELSPDQISTLAVMNAFNIEGRYPEGGVLLPSPEEAGGYLLRAGEVYKWLIHLLP